MQKINTIIQDDTRERMLKKMFGLKDSNEGRIGADAIDDLGNRFELKSGTGKSVTTTRDVGLHTLQKWLGKHWLVGFGEIKLDNFEFIEIYYLSPNDMKGFCEKIFNKINPDLIIFEEAKKILKKNNFTFDKIERLEYLVKRGYTLNNPKIPYKYIKDNGIFLNEWSEESLKNAIKLRSK